MIHWHYQKELVAVKNLYLSKLLKVLNEWF